MSNQIERVTIVGGGTAGWLTALMLQTDLNANPDEKRVEITLIESPTVPTIGVGEATLITLPLTLAEFGINEREFMRRSNASFKLAVRFADWFTDPSGQRPIFYHPFNAPPECGGRLPAYHHRKYGPPKPGMSLVDSLVPNIAILRAMKAPREMGAPDYDRHISYAYHLDAGLFAEYLRDLAIQRGIKHVRDDVLDVEKDERGYITALKLKRNDRHPVELVIDCTGFRGVVHSKVTDDPFVSFGNSLLNDRAVAVRIPHRDPTKIEPCTRATALSGGWVWRVPLFSRLGTGYVFSSAFKSDDEARDEFLAHLRASGDLPQDAPDPETRIINMNVGYRKNAWVKNCIAIGLSAGFVEPLEATAIHTIEISARWLLMNFPTKEFSPPLVKQYNALSSSLYETIRDFVQVHYLKSNRFEPYWRAAREDTKVSDLLNGRLDMWHNRLPEEYDTRADPLFTNWNYIFILEPKGHFGKHKIATDTMLRKDDWDKYCAGLETSKQKVLARLPDHYDMLTAIRGNAPTTTQPKVSMSPA
jgi:flavin-dependent dehydrogenase